MKLQASSWRSVCDVEIIYNNNPTKRNKVRTPHVQLLGERK